MHKNHKIIVVLFFLVFLLIGLSIYTDYGVSWDEGTNRKNGLISFNYIFKGDNSLLTYKDRDYGVAFELLLIFLEKIFRLDNHRDIFFMRHLCTFLMFYIGVYFFYLLCKNHFDSWKIGLLGSLFLILSPRIFAHSFYNSKDLAFLSMFIIGIYTLFKYLDKKTFLRASFHALACAILIDIRMVGILVPGLTLLFVCIDLLKSISKKENSRETIKSLLVYIFLLMFLSILFWPWLWNNPLRFLEAFKNMGKFRWDAPVLYLGNYVESTNLPWHYIPLWITITTPLFYVFNFFVGLYSSIKSTFKSPLNFSTRRKRDDLIFLLCFFLPLLAVIIRKSVLYDGWRHTFFIYPALLIIFLTGLLHLFKFIKIKLKRQSYKFGHAILILIILFSLISTVHTMIKYHPYQNIYFNILAGKDVKNNFELDYWGLSYRKALEYILKNDTSQSIKVYVENDPEEINFYFLTPNDRDRIRYVEEPEDAKYFLGNYRWHRGGYPYRNEFYAIKVKGEKIMVVYKLKE